MNTFETLGMVKLPSGLLPDPPPRNRSSGREYREAAAKEDPEVARVKRYAERAQQVRQSMLPGAVFDQLRVMADPHHERLIVARLGLAAVVPLSRFKLPPEPLLAIRYDGPNVVSVGETLSATLKYDPNVTVRLSDPPAGMKLEGNTLTWKPTSAQAGETRLMLDLISVKLTVQQLIPIVVRRPYITCSFPVNDVVISSSGTTALALGWEVKNIGGILPQPESTQLAILDLEKHAVVAEGKFDGPVTQSAIDAHYVYIMGKDPPDLKGQLTVLSNKDLSLVKTLPIVQGNRDARPKPFVTALKPIAEKYLIVDKVYSLPGLTVLPNCGANDSEDPITTSTVNGYAGRHRDYWLFDGVIYSNSELKEVSLVWGFTPFSEMKFANSGGESFPFPWSEFKRSFGGTEFQLADFPVNLKIESVKDSMTPGSALVAHGIANDQRALKQYPIAAGVMKPLADQALPISISGSDVVAVVDGFVYTFKLDELGEIPEPPHFEPRQSRFAFGSKGTTKLQYQIRGGKPPYRQVQPNLDRPVEGGFVSEDGAVEIEIDPTQEIPPFGKLKDQARNILIQEIQAESSRQLRTPATKVGKSKKQAQPKAGQSDLLNTYKDRVGAFLRQKLGANPPRGIAAPVPLHIEVLDADGKRFAMNHWMFIEIPEQEIRDHFESRR